MLAYFRTKMEATVFLFLQIFICNMGDFENWLGNNQSCDAFRAIMR